jgi:copper(I)-binding protein
MAELHESVTEDNVVRMEPRPDGYGVPPRSTVMLLPGGKHIMLMGIAEPLSPGDKITATLVFASMGEVTVTVPIKDAQ